MPSPVTDFKRYRANAQQHGPLARAGHYPSRQARGNEMRVELGDMPAKIGRLAFSKEEVEAIEVWHSDSRGC
jgi:hypothetical protein